MLLVYVVDGALNYSMASYTFTVQAVSEHLPVPHHYLTIYADMHM